MVALRSLFALVCVVAIGVATVVPALGAGPGAKPPQPALSVTDPDFSAGYRREQQRRERLRTAGARAERERSRTRYRDATRSEALDVGQDAFPDEFTARVFRGSEPAPGLHTVRALGRGTGVVEDGAGRRLLLASSLPLETTSPGGNERPVDLALTETADGFDPVNPLVDVRIAKRARGGVVFGDEDHFTVTAATNADVAGSEASDRVFFANALADSDVLVAPRPAGAEVGWQLRSADSPERLVLKLDLPAGAALRRARTDKPIPGDPPRAIEIAKGDRGLGYIYPPNAYDADGSPVRSQAAIDGDRVIVTVDHRDADARYPIFVDPEVGLPNNAWYWPGWTSAQVPSTGYYSGYNHYGFALANCAYYCNGVYLSMPTNTTFSPSGTQVYWYYQAPANTYIYRAVFANMAHSPLVNGGPFSLWYQGLLAPSGHWEQNINYVNQSGGWGPNPFGPAGHGASGVTHDFCFNPRCGRSQGSEQNFALFGLGASNPWGAPFSTGGSKATLTMSHAGIYLGDRRPPAITSAKPADRDWTDDTNATHTLGATTASDLGLGVYGISLSGGAWGNGTLRPSCTGYLYAAGHPCPGAWSTSGFSYKLNEGINTLSLQAHDIVDNNSTPQTWTQKIDRKPPELQELQGTLWPARNRDDDKRFQGLYEAGYTLNAIATDSASGVRDIEVFVDGQSQRTRGGYATGRTMNWTLRPDNYSEGTHTVRVVVRDNVAGQAGAPDSRHVTERSFVVTVDRRGDIYRATEYDDNPAIGGEAGTREAVRIGTHVSRSDDDDAVTTRTNVPCTDGETSGPLCAEWRSRSHQDLEEQDYTVYRGSATDDARVRDAAYIASTRSFRTEEAASTGSPLTSTLEPWQSRPPAAGATFEVHEVEETLQANADPGGALDEGPDPGATEEIVTVRVWLDSVTRLPIRSEVRAPDGSLVDRLYWSYEVSRLESHEVPQDYFSVGRPVSPGVDERVQMRGNQAMGPLTDTETGEQIRPWNLGELGQILLGPTLCLVDRHVVRVTETRADDSSTLSGEDAADPLQPMTILGAAYDFVQSGGTCTPGKGSLDNPAVTIEVAHRDSTLGRLWRQQQVAEAKDIQTNPTSDDFLLGGLVPVVIDASPTVAYVTTLVENTIAAFVERGDDVILIKGEITKLQLPLVAALLRTS